MTTTLIYTCGCAILSGAGDVFKPLHLCDAHKEQAFNDALQTTMEPIPK